MQKQVLRVRLITHRQFTITHDWASSIWCVEGLTGVNLDKINPKTSPDVCKTYNAMYTGKF